MEQGTYQAADAWLTASPTWRARSVHRGVPHLSPDAIARDPVAAYNQDSEVGRHRCVLCSGGSGLFVVQAPG